MTRHQLEHIIRAAGSIAQVKSFIIIGSQAILGSFPDVPASLVVSMEADLYPEEEPEKADLVDGSIGEESLFHETFGYYAHGIGPETAQLPSKWKSRLVSISNENTQSITGRCLHPVDIAVSKLLAGRPKDISYVKQLIELNYVSIADIKKCSSELDIDQQALLEKQLLLMG